MISVDQIIDKCLEFVYKFLMKYVGDASGLKDY